MNILMKVLCYGGLLLVWGVFAFLGKTPVEGFIAAIGAALASLATTHAIGVKQPQTGGRLLGTIGVSDAAPLAAEAQFQTATLGSASGRAPDTPASTQ